MVTLPDTAAVRDLRIGGPDPGVDQIGDRAPPGQQIDGDGDGHVRGVGDAAGIRGDLLQRGERRVHLGEPVEGDALFAAGRERGQAAAGLFPAFPVQTSGPETGDRLGEAGGTVPRDQRSCGDGPPEPAVPADLVGGPRIEIEVLLQDLDRDQCLGDVGARVEPEPGADLGGSGAPPGGGSGDRPLGRREVRSGPGFGDASVAVQFGDQTRVRVLELFAGGGEPGEASEERGVALPREVRDDGLVRLVWHGGGRSPVVVQTYEGGEGRQIVDISDRRLSCRRCRSASDAGPL